ncbi:MAG: amidohydrolase [Sphingomonadales bacterium]|nr:amidohydrolase [Sphingomonadales bacterium]
MDIVDVQVHMARGKIEATLEAMDALGIASVLIDEFWGGWPTTHPSHIQPGFALPNGAWRAAFPTAEEASLLHPDRFSYLVRIDPRDPQLEAVMRAAASTPHARAFRIQPVWTLAEAEGFAKDSYDALFEIAQDIGRPVCAFVPGYTGLLARYAARYPKLPLVIDHCGMGFPNIPSGRSAEEEARVNSPAHLAEVLRLAEFPNVMMKWSHAPSRFGVRDYPYEPLRPLLRQAITAFGADRLMWASDKTVMFGYTWGDLLYAVREDPELSAAEKGAILGGTARRLLSWPAPDPVQA